MGIAFIVSLTVGAALLAIWLDCRVAKRRPESAVRRFIHAVVAFGLLQVSTGVAGHLVKDGAPGGQGVTIVFFLLLPSLVYAFLTAMWLVRTLAEAARTTGR